MTDDPYVNLGWLPPAPVDFRARCRELSENTGNLGRELCALAGFALNESQLMRLSEKVGQLRQDGRSFDPLVPFRLGLVGNATLEPLSGALIATAARHGIALECVAADFGQVIQEAMSPNSRINKAKPDAVLLALDYRGLPLRAGLFDTATAAATVSEAIEFIEVLRRSFREHAGAPCIVQTIASPPETLFGHRDRAEPGTPRALITAFNQRVVEHIRDSNDVLLDIAALAETVGTASWYSPTQWNVAKFSFDAKFLPLYADHVCRVVAALRGKSRKCLILDLDNTIWGGVIGDDGLEGIVIGQGDATGEAYQDVQRAALALRERGIVLAVSSKNEDDVARSAFLHHPEMILRQDHIAVFQANWKDKATNIASIADELSLGRDAMVFLDDNPAERALVREALPEVAVPELPTDPAYYARTLFAAGYFEAVAFSNEDRQRAQFYTDNARRAALRDQVADLEGYLSSLQMRIEFSPFDANGRSRITQLINKSNQFNLTTRRYTEAEVAGLQADPSYFTMQVRLSDRFGDNGMISVIICRSSGADWEIDTWLMSCRVLGRCVEETVLSELLRHARQAGAQRLIGTYIPTEKNKMVRDHYARLGFEKLSESNSGVSTWGLAATAEIAPGPMTIDRSGFFAAIA